MANNTCPSLSFIASGLHNIEHHEGTITNDLKNDLGSSIILACILLAGSSVLLFAGARLVKPTLFLSAFGVAAVSTFALVDIVLPMLPSLSEMVSCSVMLGIPLGIGVLAGCAALCLLQVGFALLGAASGAGVGLASYSLGLNNIETPAVGSHDAMWFGCLFVGALIGMLIMCKYEKKFLIVCTSAAGAGGATPAIFLLLAHANVKFLHPTPGTAYAWAQPIVAVVLFCLGLFVQLGHEKKKKTATRVEERNVRGSGSVYLLQP